MVVQQHDTVGQIPADILPLNHHWPAPLAGQYTTAKVRHFLTGAAPFEVSAAFGWIKSVIEFTFVSEIGRQSRWYGACTTILTSGGGIRTLVQRPLWACRPELMGRFLLVYQSTPTEEDFK